MSCDSYWPLKCWIVVLIYVDPSSGTSIIILGSKRGKRLLFFFWGGGRFSKSHQLTTLLYSCFFFVFLFFWWECYLVPLPPQAPPLVDAGVVSKMVTDIFVTSILIAINQHEARHNFLKGYSEILWSRVHFSPHILILFYILKELLY